jgi:hypothetical protein
MICYFKIRDLILHPAFEASGVVLHYITGMPRLSFHYMLCFGVSRYFSIVAGTTDMSGRAKAL